MKQLLGGSFGAQAFRQKKNQRLLQLEASFELVGTRRGSESACAKPFSHAFRLIFMVCIVNAWSFLVFFHVFSMDFEVRAHGCARNARPQPLSYAAVREETWYVD